MHRALHLRMLTLTNHSKLTASTLDGASLLTVHSGHIFYNEGRAQDEGHIKLIHQIAARWAPPAFRADMWQYTADEP